MQRLSLCVIVSPRLLPSRRFLRITLMLHPCLSVWIGEKLQAPTDHKSNIPSTRGFGTLTLTWYPNLIP